MGDFIRVEGLTRKFEMGEATVTALDSVSLLIDEGEFVSIEGPSGSGKSTLLYILGALEKPSLGLAVVDGMNLSTMSESEKSRYRREMVGFVFQDFNLMGHLSAFENVLLPLVFSGVPTSERRKRGMEALDSVGLSHRSGHMPGELSGGERQRVAMARAIVTRPRILLADEPTGNLDTKTGAQIIEIIKEMNARNKLTTLLVTHDSAIAREAGRSYSMKDGQLSSSTSIN